MIWKLIISPSKIILRHPRDVEDDFCYSLLLFALAHARMGTHPHSSEKKLFGNMLSVKINFVKSQGIYLKSGLVSALNG